MRRLVRLLQRRGNCFLCLLAAAALAAAPGVSAREVEINILHTADLHGCVESAPDAATNGPAGGILRCATLVERVRVAATNVVLIDCGDIFQGSVESWLSRGAVMADILRAMRYDAVVVGNHEFDWGYDCLAGFLRVAGVPALSAGMAMPGANPMPGAQVLLCRQYDGVRLVVVGLVNPNTPLWQLPDRLGGLVFADPLDALRDALARARRLDPDILVLAAHQGWRQWGDDRANRINAIARAFPDFDLIIGAHTHQAVEAREVNGIAYTQSGPYGLTLGRVRLRYDLGRKKLTLVEPRLLAAGPDVPPSPNLLSAIAPRISEARVHLSARIGENRRALSAAPDYPGQSGVQALIAAAISEEAGADVVMHGALSTAGLPAGALCMADLWRIVPYENTICKGWLTVDEIREILDENAAYYGQEQFRGVRGISYDLSPKEPPGRRACNLRLGSGRVAEPGERISFAVNSYDLASAGGRFPRLREIMERPSSRMEDTGCDTRAAVLNYLRAHSPLEIDVEPGARLTRKRAAAEGSGGR